MSQISRMPKTLIRNVGWTRKTNERNRMPVRRWWCHLVLESECVQGNGSLMRNWWYCCRRYTWNNWRWECKSLFLKKKFLTAKYERKMDLSSSINTVEMRLNDSYGYGRDCDNNVKNFNFLFPAVFGLRSNLLWRTEDWIWISIGTEDASNCEISG